MCDKEKTALEKRAQAVRVIYTIINLSVLLAVLVFCFDARGQYKILMGGVAFLIIPLSPVFLWFLNKPCRRIHTNNQRRYLIVSRIILALAWVSMCTIVVNILTYILSDMISYQRSIKKYETTIPLVGGHEIFAEKTKSPGFLQGPATVKIHEQRIRWASGHTENFPITLRWWEEKSLSSALEVNDYVFLLAGQTLFYRSGTIASVQGEWKSWHLRMTPSLYAFLRQYAREHDDGKITFSETEEGEFVRYNIGYYSFATNGRFTLPHRTESIDSTTLQVIMTSKEPIVPMPKHLVFSVTNVPPHGIQWVFDEEATRNLLKTRAESPTGSSVGQSPTFGCKTNPKPYKGDIRFDYALTGLDIRCLMVRRAATPYAIAVGLSALGRMQYAPTTARRDAVALPITYHLSPITYV